MADKVLQSFKAGKIGKYDVLLRPFANKDSYTVFMPGLKHTVTQEDLEHAFKNYQPLVSCTVQAGNMNPMVKNGTMTFNCEYPCLYPGRPTSASSSSIRRTPRCATSSPATPTSLST